MPVLNSTTTRVLSDTDTRILSDGDERIIEEGIGIAFEAYLSGVWVNLTPDVLSGWQMSKGFNSVAPDKLMADIGTLTFELKNGTNNSAGLAGYYSPGHANCRTGFAKRAIIRLVTSYNSITEYHKFYIKSIKPSAGSYGTRRTMVVCQDKMADLARKNVGLLGVQTNVTSDELLDLIVADMTTPPDNTSFATGPDIFASAFTDIESEKMKLFAIVNHTVFSDWSRFFVAADGTHGETMTSLNRSHGSGASEVTITDEMTEIEPVVTLDNLVSRVRITAYPNAVDADIETVYTHPSELYVGPTETKDFYAKFTDSQTGERICAADVVTTLVANTHYIASSQTGGGADMNDKISISISSLSEPVGADRAHVYVENTDTTFGLYMNFFIIEGRPIRRRNTYEIEKASGSISTDGEERTISIDMPYASDVNLPDAIARKLIDDWGSEDVVRAYNVTFSANRDATLAGLAFNKRLGTKITLAETQSGLSHDVIVLGKTLTELSGEVIECRLVTDPAYGIAGWNLGVDNLGVAGETVLSL